MTVVVLLYMWHISVHAVHMLNKIPTIILKYWADGAVVGCCNIALPLRDGVDTRFG